MNRCGAISTKHHLQNQKVCEFGPQVVVCPQNSGINDSSSPSTRSDSLRVRRPRERLWPGCSPVTPGLPSAPP